MSRMPAAVAAATSSATASGARAPSAIRPTASPAKRASTPRYWPWVRGGSRHHEGCDQRGGEQSDDTPECCWWSAPTGEQRAEGLEGEAAQTEHGDEGPDHRRAPIRAAAAARTIGTPA